MKKLRNWIEIWINGKQVRGINNVPPATIWECIDIYIMVLSGKRSLHLLMEKLKKLLINAELKPLLKVLDGGLHDGI